MIRRLLFAAAAAFALTGCAVTKIDVDVYKGPLANHEDVQANQFTVMATAAKPFLVRLRDTLEWGRCSDLPGAIRLANQKTGISPKDRTYLKYTCEETDEGLDALILALGRHEPDFMLGARWRSPQAERVNAILSLYKDLVIPELEDFARVVGPARVRYDDAMAVIDYRLAPGAWDAVKGGLKQQPAREKLVDAYWKLLDLGFDRQSRERGNLLRNFDESENKSSDQLNQELAEGTRPRKDAVELFTNPTGNEATLFVARVQQRGRAFLQARAALRDIWQATMEGLIGVNGQAAPQGGHDAELRRRKTSRLLAAVGAETVQPQLAYFALCTWPDEEGFKALRDALDKAAPGIWAPGTSWKEAVIYDQAAAAIEDQLRAQPRRTAQTLLRAHTLLSTRQFDKPDEKCRTPDTMAERFPARLVHGVVRGPATLGTANDNLDDLLSAVQPGSAAGFEHARILEGLETLQDAFLKVSRADREASGADREARTREIAAAREMLVTAVVGFTQKVLSLANNDILEEAGVTRRPALISQKAADVQARAQADIQRYRIILQAIGNGMLVQADDLKRRAIHQRRLQDGGPVERRAVEAALAMTPTAYLSSLVNSAKAEAEKAKVASANADASKKVANDDLVAKKKSQKEATDAEKPLKTKAEAAEKIQTDRQAFTRVNAVYTALNTNPDAVRAALGTGKGDGKTVLALLQTVNLPATALGYLNVDAKAAIEALPEKPEKGTVYTDILALVKGRRDLAEILAEKEGADEKAYKEAQAKTKAADAAVEKAEMALEAPTKKANAAETTAQQAKAIADSLEEFRVSILKTSNRDEVALAAYERYRAAILQAKEEAKARKETAKEEALQRVADFLAARNPPLAPYRVPEGAPGENSRDVLDTVIATLREEHILALREDSAGPRAKSIADALKTAYDYRGGMAYLRPAIAYLRSSYAATSLQDESGANGWKNLLAESRSRAIPFISEGLANAGKEERNRITGEIDKQFWQTINSVRVSGAGLTNYVMVKDDIGNWYVKQYSADPTKMIESAKALAMFNLGVPGIPSPTTPPPSTSDPANPAAATAPAAAAADQTSPLDKLLTRHKDNYAAQTKTAYDNTIGIAEKLASQISGSWAADPSLEPVREPLKTHLDNEKKILIAEIEALKTDKAENRGGAITAMLHAGRRFHHRLTSALRINLKGDQEGLGVKAAEYVTLASRDVLAEATRSRKEHVAEYSRSITFIGDANK